MRTWILVGLIALIGAGLLDRPVQAQSSSPAMRVEAVTQTDAAHPGSRLDVAIVATLPEGWHTNSNAPLEAFLIPTELTVTPPAGITVERIAYPEAKRVTFSFSSTPVAVYDREFVMRVQLALAKDLAPGAYLATGALRYQACNDRTCAPPKTVPVSIAVNVVPPDRAVTPQRPELFDQPLSAAPAETGRSEAPTTPVAEPSPGAWKERLERFETMSVGSFMTASEFLRFLEDAESGRGRSATGLFEGRSIATVILLTLIGGLALNLTPCVLPLIPINIAIIGAGARASSRGRGFALGAVYGGGIALVYGALGLIVVIAGKTFGAINASPWFNGAIAVVFVALALAMFDLFLIDFTRFQAKIGLKKKEGGSYPVAFFMGGISALLAGACVAPVVIAVLLFSQDLYAKGSSAALLLPFLLGVGMALPWPFAGAGLSFLPKPGKWMERVKYAFGVFILLLAGYYGYLSYSLFTARTSETTHVAQSVAALETHGWTSSLEEGLARAASEKKPVVIDFWATWCKNCQIMNETTFKDPEVVRRLDRYVKIKYQAESPDDPPHKEILDRFRAVGLPTIVVLRPK